MIYAPYDYPDARESWNNLRILFNMCFKTEKPRLDIKVCARHRRWGGMIESGEIVVYYKRRVFDVPQYDVLCIITSDKIAEMTETFGNYYRDWVRLSRSSRPRYTL